VARRFSIAPDFLDPTDQSFRAAAIDRVGYAIAVRVGSTAAHLSR